MATPARRRPNSREGRPRARRDPRALLGCRSAACSPTTATAQVFSQHMNVFAVLYDIATPEEAPASSSASPCRGQGIDAPPGMYSLDLLLRVVPRARLRTRRHARIATSRCCRAGATCWRSTTPPGRNPASSHARTPMPGARTRRRTCWGSSRASGPAAPGYARLRVAAVAGRLTSLDATAATPHGPVSRALSRRQRHARPPRSTGRPHCPANSSGRDASFPLERVHPDEIADCAELLDLDLGHVELRQVGAPSVLHPDAVDRLVFDAELGQRLTTWVQPVLPSLTSRPSPLTLPSMSAKTRTSPSGADPWISRPRVCSPWC